MVLLPDLVASALILHLAEKEDLHGAPGDEYLILVHEHVTKVQLGHLFLRDALLIWVVVQRNCDAVSLPVETAHLLQIRVIK